MKWVRCAAALVLASVLLASLMAGLLASRSYEVQDRHAIAAPPSAAFPLGTDDLGRDRLARLLYGIRVSLLLAPAAAAESTLIAAAAGIAAAQAGGWIDRAATAVTDLFLSLPWMLLILTVRAALPLNTSPLVSVTITFAVLSLLGWASAARVVRSTVKALQASDYILQARALGTSSLRLMFAHVLPNLKPVLLAQFWISIPLFLLSEADLGVLGLGITEPLPSLGNMIREITNFSAVAENKWMLAPVAVTLLVMSCFHLLLPQPKGPQS
jgi:ABC-type dipeptide/oligopeptide/nickel transport system permease subunit